MRGKNTLGCGISGSLVLTFAAVGSAQLDVKTQLGYGGRTMARSWTPKMPRRPNGQQYF